MYAANPHKLASRKPLVARKFPKEILEPPPNLTWRNHGRRRLSLESPSCHQASRCDRLHVSKELLAEDGGEDDDLVRHVLVVLESIERQLLRPRPILVVHVLSDLVDRALHFS